MEQIRLGLENGLTREQVELYINSEYDRKQMKEVRKKLEKELQKGN